VVESLGPLFLEKMALRAFLQPVTTLIQWLASQKDDETGELYIKVRVRARTRTLVEKRIRTSGSLEMKNQYILLVTLVEMGVLWGALVPLLLPMVWSALATNLIVFRVGVFHFGARPPRDSGASLSRTYLRISAAALAAFLASYLVAITCGSLGNSGTLLQKA